MINVDKWEAFQLYKKVVEIDDLDAVGFFNLGKILHKTKPKVAI